MNHNYNYYTDQIRRNYNPQRVEIFNNRFDTELQKSAGSDVRKFVRASMNAVPKEYTDISIQAGEHAQAHLARELGTVDFAYQGSVMTNTHIKGYSDIDLLVIERAFYSWDFNNITSILNSNVRRQHYSSNQQRLLQSEVNAPAYLGVRETMMKLRANAERIMSAKYKDCDTSKAKSIAVTNHHFHRDVDVVVANWYHDSRSVINGKLKRFRGVQIFNKHTKSQENADFPFLKIALVNERSAATNGRLKRMIRFMKNCKQLTSREIKLSSFDINAIAYDIPTGEYFSEDYYGLVPVIYNKLNELSSNRAKADALRSVDGTEPIFNGSAEKFEGLQLLMAEVRAVYFDLVLVAA